MCEVEKGSPVSLAIALLKLECSTDPTMTNTGVWTVAKWEEIEKGDRVNTQTEFGMLLWPN